MKIYLLNIYKLNFYNSFKISKQLNGIRGSLSARKGPFTKGN